MGLSRVKCNFLHLASASRMKEASAEFKSGFIWPVCSKRNECIIIGANSYLKYLLGARLRKKFIGMTREVNESNNTHLVNCIS